jgi:hypothetical protein
MILTQFAQEKELFMYLAEDATYATGNHIEVMKGVASAMSNPHGGFVVIQDDLGTTASSDGSSSGGVATDIRYAPIASTGTAVSCSAVTIATI